MKTINIAQQLAIFASLATATHLHAQHYPAGSEGIKAGSIQEPGIYIQDYNSLYFSDNFQGPVAPYDPVHPHGPMYEDFKTFTYTQSPRLQWISSWKILGADFGASLRIPIEYKAMRYKVATFTQSPPFFGPLMEQYVLHTSNNFGLADIEVQPILLSWRLDQFDFSTGYSFWAPTGDYNESKLFLDNLGQGYWTHMFTFGFTWYPDPEKTWTISLLNHYEVNMTQRSLVVNPAAPRGAVSEDSTLGDIYTLEWAIGKSVIKDFDVGLTGYYQQQVTRTEGLIFNGPTWDGGKVQVAGIGPEIEATIPDWGLTASLRYAYEFTAMDHFQGNLINFTVTKSF